MFTDGIEAFEGRVTGSPISFVEVCLPHGKALDLLGRCLIERPGCRYILDKILNGVDWFSCGQLTNVDRRRGKRCQQGI